MNALITHRDAKGPWRPLTWKQGIFSNRIPKKFDMVNSIWGIIRTVILWTLWIERNDVVFNSLHWCPSKLQQSIWLGVIDYGRVEWEVVGKLKSKNLERGNLAKTRFTVRWARNDLFATMVDGTPRWALSGP